MIYYRYIKETPETQKLNLNLDLISSIFRTQRELINATKNYEFAEGDLIDYYSYQIKATKSKLDYLLKSAKNKGIVMDRIKQIEFKANENSQVS